jgi:hypothetical protein
MDIPPNCKVCNLGVEETPQHCLLECPMAQKAWNAFKRIWSDWKSNRDLEITWPFTFINEAVAELDDDTPGLLAYNPGGYTYIWQPLNIFRSLILYHLWTERCRKHFDDQYSLKKVLLQAWVATVEVGMATWKAIRSHRPARDPVIQRSIEITFRKEWLHLNIFGTDNATIRWHYLPPMYFLNFSND